jgi:polyhydroxybutyrate depolymerase
MLTHGGLERTYMLHIPPSYDGRDAVPLVVNLHGFGSNGRQQANYSGFPAKADEEGFIVVSPDGAGQPLQWDLLRRRPPDDIGFIGALIDQLEEDFCVDNGRVFVAGMSNGAALAQQLACAMPERFAAIAAVTVLFYPLACSTDRPIAVIAFHGTEDACVPFEGGPVTCGAGRAAIPSTEDAAASWARHNGCNTVPARASFSASVRTVAYSECRDETAVVLFVVQGGGHTWPGAADVSRLGVTTQEVDATDQIWDFFVGQANLRAP